MKKQMKLNCCKDLLNKYNGQIGFSHIASILMSNIYNLQIVIFITFILIIKTKLKIVFIFAYLHAG